MSLPISESSFAQAPTAPPQPRLVRAAHEFEAQLMKELLKPLTTGDGLIGSGDETGSNSALGDYAGEALGRALSDQGGFGIASRIIAQVSQSGGSQSGNRPASAPVTVNLHPNNGLGPDK
jgi:Rod binding domain-containing protein